MVSRALDVLEAAHTPPRAISTTFWVVVLLVLCIGLRLLTLGSYPLSDNTEARYAEIARIMMSGGDWINLHLPGDVVFWGKPPLSTWFSALGQLALGANEWGARLPMLVLAMMVTLIVWRWLRDSSSREAILGVAVLWGSAVFFVSAGAVMTDMALTFAVTLSIGGFWWAISGTTLTRVRLGALGLFVGLALGLLAKGPVALVLSLFPVGVHALSCRGAFRDVRSLPWIKGGLLFLGIAGPWYALAELRSPGFLEYFLVGEHWSRFTQPGWTGDLYGTAHEQTRGIVWAYLAVGFLPWSLLLPWLLIGRRRPARRVAADTRSERSPDTALLVAWALTPALLFSASRNILWTYVLPAAPALAILAGRWLARDPRQRVVHGLVATGLVILTGAAAALLSSQGSMGAIRSASGVLLPLLSGGHKASEVTFLNALPYSASFYTGGKAHDVIKDEELDLWLRRDPKLGPRHEHEFLVTTEKSWRSLSEGRRSQLHVLFDADGYVLLVRAGPAG